MTWKLLSWKVIPSALHFRGHRWKRKEGKNGLRTTDSLERKTRKAEECRMLSVVPLFYHQTEVRGLVVMTAVVMAAGLSNKHEEEMSSQPVKWSRRANRCLKCGLILCLTFTLRTVLVVETHCDASVFKYFSQIRRRHINRRLFGHVIHIFCFFNHFGPEWNPTSFTDSLTFNLM